MIDKIGNNIRPLNKKKKEEENNSSEHGSNGQQESHQHKAPTKPLHEPDIRVAPDRLKIVLAELNAHPYYQKKKLEFRELLVESNPTQNPNPLPVKIQVLELESEKVVSIIGLYRLLSIHAQINKNQDKNPDHGHLVNVSC